VNPKLAIAIQRGKEGGLTKAAIDNVFARAKSLSDGSGQNMTFEALGPGGREAFVM
jgi:transcriptional/translational regulatory protein YebC/TACO1